VLLSSARSGFKRSDANGDGKLNLTDAVFALQFLFLGGTAPACMEALDANSDGRANITDSVFLLSFMFLGGSPPAAPFPACDSAPSAKCTNSTCQK
jgi:hypothetical protein